MTTKGCSREGCNADLPDQSKNESAGRREIPNTIEIKAYFHCAMCASEFKAGQLDGSLEDMSPADYQRLQVGWTTIGLQIICHRHNANIAHIDFEGHKHPANTTRRDSTILAS